MSRVRRKSSRYRGTHTHGRGFKKKARGSGHRGGFGWSGTGKRGDQKKTIILNLYGNDYFGKSKALRAGRKPKKLSSMNVGQINEHISSLVKKGIAKDNKGVYEINLSGYKILGEGEIKIKAKITAGKASNSAIDKVKKAGGEVIVLREKKEEKKNEVKKK
jgi:large subunit ribosomal protein L15